MSGMSAVRNGSVLEHATMPLSPPRAMQQSSLNDFESDDPDVPYPVPTPGGRNEVRHLHREWYWSQHDRESYECPDCGLVDGSAMEVHHIDGDYHNGHPDNLIGLCGQCHTHRHRTEDTKERIKEWKSDFRSALSSMDAPAD